MAQISREFVSKTVTVAESGTTISFDLEGAAWGSFQFPDALTSTACTVNMSNDNSNWTAVPTLSHESNPLTVAADGTYPIPSLAFTAKHCQFVLGSSEAAEREITVFLRG